jgi:thiosulfate dehydrogenase (quinone) large subunit
MASKSHRRKQASNPAARQDAGQQHRAPLQGASLSDDRLGRYGLVFARLMIGILWITQLAWKIPPSFGCPANFAVSSSYTARTTGLCDWTGLMGVYSILPFHRAFVNSFVIPNLAWMGWFIFLMELFIAASLILGVFSRLGALVAIVQAINLLIGLSGVPNEWYWTYGMLIVLHVLFFCIPPGRTFGLDAWLRQRFSAATAGGPQLARLVNWLT